MEIISRWFKVARFMVPVVIFALLFAGLSGENYAAPEVPLLPPGLPRHVFLSRVPQLYQKQDNACGPTSLAMVLRYWNVPVTVEEIWHPGMPKNTNALKQIAHRYGVSVRDYSGNLAELMKNLAHNRPVMVRQWADEKSKRRGLIGHERVAIGYDYDKRVVFLRDPAPQGSPVIGFNEFLNLWDMSDHKIEKQRSRNWMTLIWK